MVSAQSAHAQLKLVSAANRERDQRPIHARDRRAHRRLTASQLSWLNHTRIKYGPDVSLIDLSAGGVQVETTSPLLPASTVVVELATGNKTWPVPARVLRCHVNAIAPQITYRGGLAFKRPFDFKQIAAVAPTASDVNPVHEYARLNLALKRLTETSATVAPPLSATGKQALDTAFAMIESARSRAAAAPFNSEFGRLLRVLTTALENEGDAAAVVPEIMTRLHRSVPSLTVRLVDPGQTPLTSTDAVFFRVPTEGMDVPDRLVIEFPQDCPLEVWHLQLLEAAAHLITISKDVASSRARAARVEADAALPDASQLPERRGWNRLVVRYLDGHLLKGYGHDFLPARGSVDLWDPDSHSESRITIPFAHLKAVFFVHDFEGDPTHVVAMDAEDPSLRGRRLTVTFVDGEVLRGVTLSYGQSAPGFFMLPLDSTGNNAKIFVPAGAIRHVQFHDASNRTSAPQPVLSAAR